MALMARIDEGKSPAGVALSWARFGEDDHVMSVLTDGTHLSVRQKKRKTGRGEWAAAGLVPGMVLGRAGLTRAVLARAGSFRTIFFLKALSFFCFPENK